MFDYLLDVNVLVAHAILEHEHHHTVADRLLA
jgi:predicted nucleic acid-binding protein